MTRRPASGVPAAGPYTTAAATPPIQLSDNVVTQQRHQTIVSCTGHEKRKTQINLILAARFTLHDCGKLEQRPGVKKNTCVFSCARGHENTVSKFPTHHNLMFRKEELFVRYA